MQDWDLKSWLEALSYLTAILCAFAVGIAFLTRKRRSDIAALTEEIARGWTNEGDINSNEPFFTNLALELADGDVIGLLTFSNSDEELSANVDVHWFSATLHVTRLIGRSVVPVGKVKLRLTGNRNRLEWKAIHTERPGALPWTTQLWPLPPRPTPLSQRNWVPIGR